MTSTTAARTSHLAVRAVDPARAAAIGRLLDDLERIEGRGLWVPCRAGLLDPAAWVSEDEDTARTAASACAGCPALEACRAYIDDHPEPAGVWAGTTAKQRRTEQKMNDETTPERRQLDLARDALAVVRAQFAGDQEGAVLLTEQLMRDPANVPGVVGSLVSMLQLAVGLHAMPPAEFLAAMQRTIDDAEAGA